MASYVAAYRVGALVSGAGTLFLVSGVESLGFTTQSAWTAGYAVMGLLVLVGIGTTLLAVEPAKSEEAAAEHAAHAQDSYPSRPVKVVAPFAAGGSTAMIAMMDSARLSRQRAKHRWT